MLNLKLRNLRNLRNLDSRKGQNGAELDVEMLDKKDRGQAVLKIFGPNSRKECTLMINKSKSKMLNL